MKNTTRILFFVLSLLSLKFTDTVAQRISVDSLYQKNSFGIELGSGFGLSINHPTYEGFNRLTLANRLGATYFFANRWAVNSGITHTIFRSNRPDLRPKEDYWHGDLTVRYHIRNWYFGVGTSYGNSPISILYNDLVAYAPREKLVVYGNVGLHTQLSKRKKFWKNAFFVLELKVGPALYTAYKPDGLSKNLNTWGGHMGIHYIIKPKKRK